MGRFKSTHKLEFKRTPDYFKGLFGKKFDQFKIGTCNGLYQRDADGVKILAVLNEEPNNGHFTDVMEWFSYFAKKDEVPLIFLEVWNHRLKRHLIEKHGFEDCEILLAKTF